MIMINEPHGYHGKRSETRRRDGNSIGGGIESMWSAFTSNVGDVLDPSSSTTTIARTTMTEASSSSPVSSSSSASTTTMAISNPVATVSVDTSTRSTSYVTVPLTTGVVTLLSPTSGLSGKSFRTPMTATSPLASEETCVPSVASATCTLSGTTTRSAERNTTTLSSVVALSVSISQTSTFPLETYQPSSPTSAALKEQEAAAQASHKRAIIGGLCGAIAGLILIGIIISLLLRRGRKCEGEAEDAMNEKGLAELEDVRRPETPMDQHSTTAAAAVSEVGSPNRPRLVHIAPISASVDEENRMIRMSLHNWDRPFAHGRGEGIRDSVAPGQLRVMNPDPSRPHTPEVWSLTSNSTAGGGGGGGFLRKHLATVILHGNRSRTDSPIPGRRGQGVDEERQQQQQTVPDITIDPALSQEYILRPAPTANTTPSFKSGSSVTTTVQQLPPEDPFATPPPPDETATPRLPALRALSSLLHPFRNNPKPSLSQVHVVDNKGHRDRASYSSTQSSGRPSRYSDPFDLDRPSVRGSGIARERESLGAEWPLKNNWTVYEGT